MHRFFLGVYNFRCMLVRQLVASYRPVVGKWSCMQMALNSYGLMCVASSGKDFSSEFLHQTLAKTFSIWLLCNSAETRLSYFIAAWVQEAFTAKKPQRTRLAWRSYTVLCLYTGWFASRLEIPAWKSLSWSSRKTCWWRRNCIGRNYPNERNQTIDSLLWVQPESGERHFTRQLAKLDFWPWFQPEPGERHFARHFAKLDFRPSFQPEPG